MVLDSSFRNKSMKKLTEYSNNWEKSEYDDEN